MWDREGNIVCLQMVSICNRQLVLFVNPLPNEIILDMTILKTFADDKLDIATIMISLFE